MPCLLENLSAITIVFPYRSLWSRIYDSLSRHQPCTDSVLGVVSCELRSRSFMKSSKSYVPSAITWGLLNLIRSLLIRSVLTSAVILILYKSFESATKGLF